jgi:hypothetical protein
MEHPANRIIAKPADLSLFAGFLTESGTSAGKSGRNADFSLRIGIIFKNSALQEQGARTGCKNRVEGLQAAPKDKRNRRSCGDQIVSANPGAAQLESHATIAMQQM